MEWDENLNLEGGPKQHSILLRILNPLKSESICILGFYFFCCSHRIKLFNMDISPDSDYNSVPHSESRVGKDGVQILDLNDEKMQERWQNLL